MTLQIRGPPAGGSRPAAGRVVVDGYTADGYLEPGDDYGSWLGDTAARAADVLVAVLDGEVIGSITWCPPGSSHREVAAGDDEGEFRALAVDPAHRGLGAARALVEYCLGAAASLGLSRVWLGSRTTQTKAHRLYESMGFRRVPERDWSPPDAPDIILLAFVLEVAPTLDHPGSALE